MLFTKLKIKYLFTLLGFVVRRVSYTITFLSRIKSCVLGSSYADQLFSLVVFYFLAQRFRESDNPAYLK